MTHGLLFYSVWIGSVRYNPEAASTCYKIMHDILPTKHKVDQMSRNKQPSQGRCTFCPQYNDDVIHALSLCSRSLEAAQCLLKVIKKVNANITLVDAVYFQGDFGNSPLPLAWIISTSLHLIWSSRPQGGLTATKLMSELIANLNFYPIPNLVKITSQSIESYTIRMVLMMQSSVSYGLGMD